MNWLPGLTFTSSEDGWFFHLVIIGIEGVEVDLTGGLVVVETTLSSSRIKELIETSGRRAVLQGMGTSNSECSSMQCFVLRVDSVYNYLIKETSTYVLQESTCWLAIVCVMFSHPMTSSCELTARIDIHELLRWLISPNWLCVLLLPWHCMQLHRLLIDQCHWWAVTCTQWVETGNYSVCIINSGEHWWLASDFWNIIYEHNLTAPTVLCSVFQY